MEDDTVKIHEERVGNSGHAGGLFLGRCRLRKDLGKTGELTPSLAKGAKPICYEASDFYVGAKIRACGMEFVITDADLAVFSLMEDHAEIYPGKKVLHTCNTLGNMSLLYICHSLNTIGNIHY